MLEMAYCVYELALGFLLLLLSDVSVRVQRVCEGHWPNSYLI